MKAKAKYDIKVLMEGNRFSNFIKGNYYRVHLSENEAVLMDEDKMGYSCSLEEFYNDFELIEEKDC